MTDKKKQSRSANRKTPGNTAEVIGGREFGNVIEPTQAQMASGNQGLAAEQKSPKKKPARKRAA